uniref:Glutamate receptor n=3 Tax=Cajanus cajan TaxID=3821 RepID=A0A151QV07_CAJCA|nr:Glutamate receptor 2.7 [Cajanus cajan]
MNFHGQTSKALSNFLLWPSLISLLLFQCLIAAQVVYSFQNTSVGVVIDVNSETGKQQIRAMQIAVQSFNNYSKNHNNIKLFFHNSGGNPLQAASAAEELIDKKKVKVIVGMGTWQEAALVADLGNKAQIPIISFSSPLVIHPLMQHRWPFLIQMAKNQSAQMNCIADIIHVYNWQKVIVIYEDNPYSSDSGMLGLFSEALQKGNAQIESRLVLPPFTSLSDPKGFVLDELIKLLPLNFRVFVVLQASYPMVTHLFREANKIGLLGKDSAWIINEGVTNMLDLANKSVLSSMEGTLGIKTYYSTNSLAYTQLEENFQHGQTETAGSKPGSDALQAYDSVTIIAKALEKMNSNSSNSRVFLEKMLSSNFNGLSGNIRFRDSHLSNTPVLRVINLVNKEYKELDFWTPELKFAASLKILKDKKTRGDYTTTNLTGPVVWPGGLISAYPKGWKMPTDAEPLKVAIPINPAFDNFLKVDSQKQYVGFCIDLFHEVRNILRDRYSGMPYEFYPFNESYEQLLLNVINKSHDAIVGDVTILANRSKDVLFTQPYTESGLSVIFPKETEGSAWLFMKPFSWEMWMATVGILIYTMFIVWFLEHRFNPDFGGPLKNQISTTVWFAFTSLFFAHREKISSNSARLVVGVWLFLVFVLTSSYTANLSSMLTVKRMKSGRDIEWLKQNNLSVGCEDSSSFVKNYMMNVYDFHPQQIVVVNGEHDIVEKFKSKTISALFLESPYEKVFLNKYCKDYTAITAAYRFGGLGFVFQKGSPMAKDFSEAILTLAENGTLKHLEEYWLTPSTECSNSSTTPETESLTLNNFWGLYIICAAISTICFVRALLIYYLLNHKHYHHEEEVQLQGNVTADHDDSVWNKAIRIGTGFYNNAYNKTYGRAATFGGRGTQVIRRGNSSRWESINIFDDVSNPHHRSLSAVTHIL